MIDLELEGFKNTKSILPNFSFIGLFYDNENPFGWSDIKPYHIRSVSYEQHTFKQEGQYHGPGILKTFPVLDRGEAGAYKLTIVFEEDKQGTILKFIEYLKRKIINTNGVYNPIAKMKDLIFELTILHQPKNIQIIFHELYFQTAESNEFSYADGDMKTYTVSLAYDNYQILEV